MKSNRSREQETIFSVCNRISRLLLRMHPGEVSEAIPSGPCHGNTFVQVPAATAHATNKANDNVTLILRRLAASRKHLAARKELKIQVVKIMEDGRHGQNIFISPVIIMDFRSAFANLILEI
jgi:hypothetical protein